MIIQAIRAYGRAVKAAQEGPVGTSSGYWGLLDPEGLWMCQSKGCPMGPSTGPSLL